MEFAGNVPVASGALPAPEKSRAPAPPRSSPVQEPAVAPRPSAPEPEVASVVKGVAATVRRPSPVAPENTIDAFLITSGEDSGAEEYVEEESPSKRRAGHISPAKRRRLEPERRGLDELQEDVSGFVYESVAPASGCPSRRSRRA